MQGTDDRQARLKKALKANLARRKGAALARTGQESGDSPPSDRNESHPSRGTEQEQDQNG